MINFTEFVAGEQDDSSGTVSTNIRNTGYELISQICKNGKENAFKYILSLNTNEDLNKFNLFNIDRNNSTYVSTIDIKNVLKIEGVMWIVGSIGVLFMKHVKCEARYLKRGVGANSSMEVYLCTCISVFTCIIYMVVSVFIYMHL
jgi:hypothetical protein